MGSPVLPLTQILKILSFQSWWAGHLVSGMRQLGRGNNWVMVWRTKYLWCWESLSDFPTGYKFLEISFLLSFHSANITSSRALKVLHHSLSMLAELSASVQTDSSESELVNWQIFWAHSCQIQSLQHPLWGKQSRFVVLWGRGTWTFASSGKILKGTFAMESIFSAYGRKACSFIFPVLLCLPLVTSELVDPQTWSTASHWLGIKPLYSLSSALHFKIWHCWCFQMKKNRESTKFWRWAKRKNKMLWLWSHIHLYCDHWQKEITQKLLLKNAFGIHGNEIY